MAPRRWPRRPGPGAPNESSLGARAVVDRWDGAARPRAARRGGRRWSAPSIRGQQGRAPTESARPRARVRRWRAPLLGSREGQRCRTGRLRWVGADPAAAGRASGCAAHHLSRDRSRASVAPCGDGHVPVGSSRPPSRAGRPRQACDDGAATPVMERRADEKSTVLVGRRKGWVRRRCGQASVRRCASDPAVMVFRAGIDAFAGRGTGRRPGRGDAAWAGASGSTRLTPPQDARADGERTAGRGEGGSVGRGAGDRVPSARSSISPGRPSFFSRLGGAAPDRAWGGASAWAPPPLSLVWMNGAPSGASRR